MTIPFSLVGVIKGVFTTIIGFFTFGGVPVTALVVLGVLLNSLGGATYSYAKYSEKVTSEIEKHFHKHTIRVKSGQSTAEHLHKSKNGFVNPDYDLSHKVKNGLKKSDVVRIHEAEVIIEVDEKQGSSDSVSSSESSVD